MKRFIFAVTFLLPLTVSAANFQAGEAIEVDPVGNSYAAGNIVQVTSEVSGDVYLAGETININERVREDAFLAGKSVTINAPIGDDLHVFGGTIIINSDVRGDVIAFGSKVVITPESRISGEVYIGGESITINGQFDEEVQLSGSSVETAGLFLKNLSVKVRRSVIIQPDADIRGNLSLKTPEEMAVTVPEGVVRGEVVREALTVREHKPKSLFLIPGVSIFSLLSRFVIGGILILCLRTFACRFGEKLTAKGNFWRILGIGFLTVIAPPILAVLLFLPILTIPLAAALFVMWGVSLYFGSLLSGLLVANLLFPLRKADSPWMLLGKYFLGTVLLSLLHIVPIVGSLLIFIVCLLTLGSILEYKMGAWKILQKAHYL